MFKGSLAVTAFHTFLDSFRLKKKKGGWCNSVWPVLKQNWAGLLRQGLVDTGLLLETGMAIATDGFSLV